MVGAKDKYDLMRFDASGVVSASMFDESWRRYVIKRATGSGKTKVMSLALSAGSFLRKNFVKSVLKLHARDSQIARPLTVRYKCRLTSPPRMCPSHVPKKKKGYPMKDNPLISLVGSTGLEPVAPAV